MPFTSEHGVKRNRFYFHSEISIFGAIKQSDLRGHFPPDKEPKLNIQSTYSHSFTVEISAN